MSVREAFAPYLDESGWVKDGERASNNRILDTASYYTLLAKSNELTLDDRAKALDLFKSCEVEPGLFNRTPNGAGGQESNDDYAGLMTCALMLDLPIAHDVLGYGKAHHWVYNNVEPGKFSFPAYFQRFLALIAHFYVCNRITPPLLYRIGWCYAVGSTGKKDPKDRDPYRLSWQLVEAFKHSGVRSGMMDRAVADFTIALYSNWPKGMRDVERAYRAKPNPFQEVWID